MEKKHYPNLSLLLQERRDDSKSPAMMKHSFDVVKDAFHQPPYGLTKKMEWNDPNTYGQLMTMTGRLRADMAFINTVQIY